MRARSLATSELEQVESWLERRPAKRWSEVKRRTVGRNGRWRSVAARALGFERDNYRNDGYKRLNVRPSLLDENRIEDIHVAIVMILFLMMRVVVDRAVRRVNGDRRLLSVEAHVQMRIDKPRTRKGEQHDECDASNEEGR
jgi:hypothetical protein